MVIQRPGLARYALLSVLAALATIGIKAAAYAVTGSMGLWSDALESVVNLAAALMALGVLLYAEQPPDEDHAFGHEKAEYFSSGLEGGLILVAALSIAVPAVNRMLYPQDLVELGLGAGLSLLASAINGVTAWVLLRVGRRYRSVTLEADAHHLLTDVWSSLAVVLGLGMVYLTGWSVLDPILALGIAGHITYTGVHLLRRSAAGLLDVSLPPEQMTAIRERLDAYADRGVSYHALRTRCSGRRTFVQVHVLVPGSWTVHDGHHLVEEIEEEIRALVPGASVLTHLEPLEDPRSFHDIELDRSSSL